MDTPYITVTLEVSGYSDEVMADLHTRLRGLLREWHTFLSYGELTIAYQDQDQIEDDAKLDIHAVDEDGIGFMVKDEDG